MSIQYTDNKTIKSNPERYETVCVSTTAIIKSWKTSLFSYEWLLPDGRIKDLKELPAAEQPKRKHVEEQIQQQQTLERPILGIGLLENVEIGSKKEIFLTLAANGTDTIEVHIPKNNHEDFVSYIVS